MNALPSGFGIFSADSIAARFSSMLLLSFEISSCNDDTPQTLVHIWSLIVRQQSEELDAPCTMRSYRPFSRADP